METSERTSDAGPAFTSGTEAMSNMMQANWAGTVELATNVQTTMARFQLSFLHLLGGQLQRNATLLARLTACTAVEDLPDVYMAHAADTLVHCERELSKVIATGTRAANSAVAAALRPALSVRAHLLV